MQNWFWVNMTTLSKVFVSTICIFSILIGVVRLSGLRSFAKMSSIDFASTIAIGSVLAATLLNDNPQILKGGAAIGFILLFQTVFSKLTLRFNWFDKLVSNQPLLLMKSGEFLPDNLYKSNMSEADLLGKLREANVIQLSEVYAVVLESTGDVSVLHGKEDLELEDILLKNVQTD